LAIPEENSNCLKKIPKLGDPAHNSRLGLMVWSFGSKNLIPFLVFYQEQNNEFHLTEKSWQIQHILAFGLLTFSPIIAA